MSDLTVALAKWSSLWSGLGAPSGDVLMRPGLSAEDIRAQLTDSGLVPCDDVVEWYCWADGSASPQWALPGSGLVGLSLADALRWRKDLWAVASDLAADGLFETVGGVESRYRREWLPLAQPLGSGGELVVELGRQVAHPSIKRLDWVDGLRPVHDIEGTLVDIVGHWTRVLQTGLIRFFPETSRWQGDIFALPPGLLDHDLVN
ncbi:MAG: hypothetical protein EPO13_00275 [Actinomycetota bacterium]|nr:MAG: hypothetical protein EPO13_00275 [Actinomycetota bacterium]